MNNLRIMVVCGFGIGTSVVLKVKIDQILKDKNIKAEVFTSDIATADSNRCDIIFTSKQYSEELRKKIKVPIIEIVNFVNRKEIEDKINSMLEDLGGY